MIRKEILNIYDKNLVFFVANCENVDNPVAHLNVSAMQKEMYSFGIVLNGVIDDPVFDCISTPLYSTIDAADYFVLDVIHEPYQADYTLSSRVSEGQEFRVSKDSPKEQVKLGNLNFTRNTISQYYQKKMRFIFVDIESLYQGKFDIYKNDTALSQSTTLQNNEQDFDNWLIQSITENIFCENLFIVTNKTPFYYLSLDPSNKYINRFLNILETHAKSDIIYLSTDNDYFNNIFVYKTFENSNLVSKINYILVGKLGEIIKRPSIFNKKINMQFFKRIYFCHCSYDISGYVQIQIHSIGIRIDYRAINSDNIVNDVIHYIIRIIEKTNTHEITNQEKKILRQYLKFAQENNYFNIYKYSKSNKKYSTNILREKLINSILPKINSIIGDTIQHDPPIV